MIRIEDVEQIHGEMIRRLSKTRTKVTRDSYRRAHDMHVLRSKTIHRTHESKLSLVMEVNHNRWVGTCPECNAGVVTGRDWPVASCFSCGARFTRVVWPESIEAVEELLIRRPLAKRNWFAHEPLDQLRAENIVNGIDKVTL
jgi:hypothetical protein